MSYATLADLTARFGRQELLQLTDPDGQVINAAVVANALADADSLIDAHLQGRYTLPLATPVPRLVVNMACELARALLYGDRITDAVRQRQTDNMMMLGRLADGRMSLAEATGEQPAQSRRVVSGQASSNLDWSKFGGVR